RESVPRRPSLLVTVIWSVPSLLATYVIRARNVFTWVTVPVSVSWLVPAPAIVPAVLPLGWLEDNVPNWSATVTLMVSPSESASLTWNPRIGVVTPGWAPSSSGPVITGGALVLTLIW